jgi:YVTN family beta-propeller protein
MRSVPWITALLFAIVPAAAEAASCLGPSALAVSGDGKSLYVACADARRILVLDAATGKVARSIALPAEPTSLLLDGDGRRLFVSCAAATSTIVVIETHSGAIAATLAAGHTATGMALSPDGRTLYVCQRFNNDVAVLDVATGKTVACVPVIREPCGAVITPDGKTLFVINQLPSDRSDGDPVSAQVSVIDVATRRTLSLRLPNGSSSVRGLCVSPDGKLVFVVHILSRYALPTTQLERGWMNTNALTVIDVARQRLAGTVLLDDLGRGAANPWAAAVSPDGRVLCVSHAGTHELSLIDLPALLARLGKADAAEVANDLVFLAGIRRRVRLAGAGPRGLVIAGKTAYVAEYFSDSLGVVDLEPAPGDPREIALGPPPRPSLERRGEMLFHDATICFQHWQSCASCHPDARADGLNWDLLNDGLGNPKNTRSLLLVHEAGPSMATGIRNSAGAAVRAGLEHILFAARPESEARAIDAYLKSLQPVPSPLLRDGRLSPAAERGKQLFFDAKIGCATCHPAPLYTDQKSHDVGHRGVGDKPGDAFYTPRLIEVWRTAPYLHDGHYLTIKDLLIEGKHGSQHSDLLQRSPRDIDDLVEFVLSL